MDTTYDNLDVGAQPQGKSILLAMSWYDHRTHLGISRFAKRHGWRVDARMANSTELAWGWKGDGVITKLGCSAIDQDLLAFLGTLDCPIVDLSVFGPSLGYPSIEFDPDQIGRLAATHFLERGFAHFGWFPQLESLPVRMRSAGFARAVSALTGESVHWIGLPESSGEPSDWASEEKRLGEAIARLPKPMAVMCFNDEWGSRVIRACEAVGLRIPEEVAVLGVDDNQLICDHQPIPLSSVQLDLESWGMIAAERLGLLMSTAAGSGSTSMECIAPRGISTRQSTEVISVQHGGVAQAASFIAEHYAEGIAVSDVIAQSRLSGSGLKQAFRKHLGRSINDELRRVRCEQTRRLLSETDWTLDHIAQSVGLNDSRGLHRLFAQFHDETPTEFRKRSGGGGA